MAKKNKKTSDEFVFMSLEDLLVQSGRRSELSKEEIDEIEELRQIILQIENPEPQFHTST